MQITIASPTEPAAPKLVWPENPYKGLSFYTSGDVALFGGREAEVKTCTRVVARESTKVLLLQGSTGCGKSSFLRAGLIPYLESEVERFQFLSAYDINDVKALFIRCTDAPLTRLCETLFDWGEKPIYIHLPDADPEEIPMAEIRDGKDRATFVEQTASSVPKLIEVLRAVEARLPKTAVLVLDQGEEVLTLNDRDDNRNKHMLFDFLIAFSTTTIDLKIIVALRKEYFGDFYEELSRRRFNTERVAVFLLQELSTEQLVEVIRFPTSRDILPKYLQGRPQPGDYYNFDIEAGLPEGIVRMLRSVKTEGGILPVLQITCERLFRLAKARHARGRQPFRLGQAATEKPWIIISTDLAPLGDLERQIDLYVDETIQEEIQRQRPKLDEVNVSEELALWKDILFSIVLRRPDNTAVTIIRSKAELLLTATELGCEVDSRQMIKALARDERRILRRDQRGPATEQTPRIIDAGPPLSHATDQSTDADDEDDAYFSLGHDAIAVALSKWSATRKIILGRRAFVKRSLNILTKIFAIYFLVAALILAAITFSDRLEWETVAIIGTLASWGGVIMVFSEKIANNMLKIVIRVPLFRRSLGPASSLQ
jgi:hypothetical protein